AQSSRRHSRRPPHRARERWPHVRGLVLHTRQPRGDANRKALLDASRGAAPAALRERVYENGTTAAPHPAAPETGSLVPAPPVSPGWLARQSAPGRAERKAA